MPQSTHGLYDRSVGGRTGAVGVQYQSNTASIDNYHIVDSLGYGSTGSHRTHGHKPIRRETGEVQGLVGLRSGTTKALCDTTFDMILEKPSSWDDSTAISEERDVGGWQSSVPGQQGKGTLEMVGGDHGVYKKGAHKDVSSGIVLCRVPGCRSNVSSGSPSHVENTTKCGVCEVHRTSLFVMIGGLMQRFCDGCKEFHHIEAFQNNSMVCANHGADPTAKKPGHQVSHPTTTPETPAHTVSPRVAALHQEESPPASPPPVQLESNGSGHDIVGKEPEVAVKRGRGRKRATDGRPVDGAPKKRGRPKKVRAKVQPTPKKSDKAIAEVPVATNDPVVQNMPCGCAVEFMNQVLRLLGGESNGTGSGKKMPMAMIGDGVFVSYSSLMKMLHVVNISLAVLDEPFSGKQINIDGALAADPPKYLPQDLDFTLQRTANRTSSLLKLIANKQRNTIQRPQTGVMSRPTTTTTTTHCGNNCGNNNMTSTMACMLPQQVVSMQRGPMYGYQNNNNSIMRQHQETMMPSWQDRSIGGGGGGGSRSSPSSQDVLGELEQLILYGHR